MRVFNSDGRPPALRPLRGSGARGAIIPRQEQSKITEWIWNRSLKLLVRLCASSLCVQETAPSLTWEEAVAALGGVQTRMAAAGGGGGGGGGGGSEAAAGGGAGGGGAAVVAGGAAADALPAWRLCARRPPLTFVSGRVVRRRARRRGYARDWRHAAHSRGACSRLALVGAIGVKTTRAMNTGEDLCAAVHRHERRPRAARRLAVAARRATPPRSPRAAARASIRHRAPRLMHCARAGAREEGAACRTGGGQR